MEKVQRIPADVLECEPGQTRFFSLDVYQCPFCKEVLLNVNFTGLASDDYIVDSQNVIRRLFWPMDSNIPTCSCEIGFWVTTDPPMNNGLETMRLAEMLPDEDPNDSIFTKASDWSDFAQ